MIPINVVVDSTKNIEKDYIVNYRCLLVAEGDGLREQALSSTRKTSGLSNDS